MYKISKNSSGKSYKQVAKCNHCGKRFVVDNSKSGGYHSMYYCSECYKKAYPSKKSED